MNLDDIHLQIADAKNHFRDERYALDQIFREVDALKAKGEQIRRKRDECNQKVKDLIGQGKEAQRKRDDVNKKIAELKGQKRQASQTIKSQARQITKGKQTRNQFHTVAKGTPERLQKNAWGSLKTILEMDLTLKNEAILFEMFFEAKDRFFVSLKASEAHEKVQSTYSDLKETESVAQNIYDEIGFMIVDSQKFHDESVTLFRQKDEAREEADKYHQEFLDNGKAMREFYKKVDAKKAQVNKAFKKLKELEGKVGSWRKLKREQEEIEKLATVKKAESGKKMGMDELKLLLDKGAFKDEK